MAQKAHTAMRTRFGIGAGFSACIDSGINGFKLIRTCASSGNPHGLSNTFPRGST